MDAPTPTRRSPLNEPETHTEAGRDARCWPYDAGRRPPDPEPQRYALLNHAFEATRVLTLFQQGFVTRTEAFILLGQAFRRCRDSQGRDGRS
jgi:hypothetical protein